VAHLTVALGRIFAYGDPAEPIELSRLACAVGQEGPHADVHAAVLSLLDAYEAAAGAPAAPGEPFPEAVRLLVAAATVARTPDVPLPAVTESPPLGA
jgi:hypothetical protein